MKINNLETLLLQEMEEVKGGGDLVCHSHNEGSYAAPTPGSSCHTLSGQTVECGCNGGALSKPIGEITPTPSVPDKPDPAKP